MDQEKAALLLKQMLNMHIIDLDRDSFSLAKPAGAGSSKDYELHIKAHLNSGGRLCMQQITAKYSLKIREDAEKIVVCDQ